MPTDRVERLHRLEHENLERSTSTTAALQRLLAELAAAGSGPDQVPAGLARAGQEQAVSAYQRLTEAAVRFISQAAQLAFDHRDDYLRGLLAPGHVPAAPPMPVPLPSGGYDPAWWVGWYQLLVRWVVEQQARSAMLYRAVADETAAGRLPRDRVQSSAQEFLETRLEGYLVEVAWLSAGLVSEVLDVMDSSVQALTAAAAGRGAAAQVVLEVSGPAAGTVTTGLLIENAHHEPASVTCVAVPAGAFGINVVPAAMRLEAGESRRLAVHVALPPVPAAGPAVAGWITIRGHGETDLRAEVRARVGDPLTPDSTG